MGFFNFAPGDLLTDTRMDEVMRQGIIPFASTAARDSALAGILAEPLYTYQTDTNEITYYDGAAWRTIYKPPTSWTPSWTNLSVGNGVVTASYSRSGDSVQANVKLVLGSTSSVSGSVSTTLPVATTSTQPHVGGAVLTDAGTRTYCGNSFQNGSSITVFHTEGVGTITSTSPFTWTTNDEIYYSVTYAVL